MHAIIDSRRFGGMHLAEQLPEHSLVYAIRPYASQIYVFRLWPPMLVGSDTML